MTQADDLHRAVTGGSSRETDRHAAGDWARSSAAKQDGDARGTSGRKRPVVELGEPAMCGKGSLEDAGALDLRVKFVVRDLLTVYVLPDLKSDAAALVRLSVALLALSSSLASAEILEAVLALRDAETSEPVLPLLDLRLAQPAVVEVVCLLEARVEDGLNVRISEAALGRRGLIRYCPPPESLVLSSQGTTCWLLRRLTRAMEGRRRGCHTQARHAN
mmetsp:Transcript_68741/g.201282  ORF Transcript_68741/g.201282 Transcript_68741/m.201282 type:complete len:218 (+) Transcript_68741:730-1383(+)